MSETEALALLDAPPDPEQAKDRDVVRVARVRAIWKDERWHFDKLLGVSTYYEQREVDETPARKG